MMVMQFEKQDVLSFSSKRFANLIFLPIQLQGMQMTACFDTGASISVLTESTAKKLSMKKQNQILHAGNNQGTALSLETGVLEELCIQNRKLTNVCLGILPDRAFDFGQDDEGNSFPADILLGWDIISRFCWHFDMKERCVRIQTGGTMPKSNHMWHDCFLQFPIEYQGMKLIAGFDSGHTETMLDESWMNRIQEKTLLTSTITGINSISKEDVYQTLEVPLLVQGEEVILKNVEILSHKIHGAEKTKLCILLGMDIMKDRIWTLDSKSNYFEFK